MTTLKAKYSNLRDFKEDLYRFDSFDQFYVKLITILSLICRDEKKYCFCNKYNKNPLMMCPLCYIPIYFWNFKDDLKKNRIDAIFLARYRDRLFPSLVKCFIMNQSSIAAFAGPFITIYDSKRTFLS